MQPTQIVFNINTEVNPIGSLRGLQSPPPLIGKPVILYQQRLNGSRTLIRVLNGTMLGFALSKCISEKTIDQLSTTKKAVPDDETPTMYCLYYDPLYTIDSGVWELFIGDCKDPDNQKTLYFPDGDNMMDYFNSLFGDTIVDAYYLHHYFAADCVSKTDYVVLQGMK